MGLFHQGTGHNLGRCWRRSMWPHSVTRQQRVKKILLLTKWIIAYHLQYDGRRQNKFLPRDFNCIAGLSIVCVYRCQMTLCIVQLHPITIYRTGFGVCAVLELSIITCPLVLFHRYYYWDFYGHPYGHSLWTSDWTCNIRNPLCHV